MNWIAIACCSIIFGVVCLLLGLTAGLNFNPDSTIRYVPAWGSLGEWVSGLGALLAVGFALWQSSDHRSRDRVRTALIDKSSPNRWRVRLISEGLIPVTVLGASLKTKNITLDLSDYFKAKPGFVVPSKLERGEVQQIVDLDSADFLRFQMWFLGPILTEVASHGLSARGLNYGVSEEYFDAIDEYREAGAELIVRLAHDDIVHRVSQEVVDNILFGAVTSLRQKAEQQAAERRAEDRKFFEEFLPPRPNE